MPVKTIGVGPRDRVEDERLVAVAVAAAIGDVVDGRPHPIVLKGGEAKL